MKWEGLTEFRAALRALPAHLAAEAAPIVEKAAAEALVEARAGYERRPALRPGESRTFRGTGNLVSGLRIRPLASTTSGVLVQLVNVAPHAGLYENGTAARRTALGHFRGSMPPGHVFLPAVYRARTRMVQRLIELLTREGFTLRGHA